MMTSQTEMYRLPKKQFNSIHSSIKTGKINCQNHKVEGFLVRIPYFIVVRGFTSSEASDMIGDDFNLGCWKVLMRVLDDFLRIMSKRFDKISKHAE